MGEVAIRLQPRARRNEIVGMRADAFLLRVTAPPVDGRANEALCRLVATAAGVAPSRVAVVRGLTSRDKVVRVEGVDDADLRRALQARP
jgi:uncharacterized protein (TIGR00251 family)